MKKFLLSIVVLAHAVLGFAQPQKLTYFLETAPWGYGHEELMEMYSGRIIPASEIFNLNPSLIPFFLDNEDPVTFIGGYELGDYNVILAISGLEKEEVLTNLLAFILPSGEQPEQTFNNILSILNKELGESATDSVGEKEALSEGSMVSWGPSWYTERSYISSFLAYNTSDPDTPCFYGFTIYDLHLLMQLYELLATEDNLDVVVEPEEGEAAAVEAVEVVEAVEEAVEAVEPVESDNEATMKEFEDSMTTLDNDANHMHFRGVSFNQTAEEFCAELEKLGYTHHPEYTPLAATSAPRAIMQGEYGGSVCDIYVFCTPTSGKVFYVRILLQFQNSWGELWSEYEIFKRRLTNICGEPEVEEVFSDLYGVGTGLEIEGIKKGLNNIISTFTIDNEESSGYIYLSIQADEEDAWVNLAFYDYFNLVLRESEYEALM